MKPSSGSIPEEIAVITGDTIMVQVGCPWDFESEPYYYNYNNAEDDEDNKVTIPEPEKIEVLPAFIADNASPNSIASGKKWASYSHKNHKAITPKVEVKKNVPIKNVKICSLEQRGNGGRAYKVIADGVYVDCREDVIIDAMLTEGIDKGGILRGEYIWVKLGASSRLIRTGSALHKKLALLQSRKKLKKIEVKDLVVGTIYATLKDKRALYLGKVNSTSLSTTGKSLPDLEQFDFHSHELKDQPLFIQIPEFGEKNIQSFLESKPVQVLRYAQIIHKPSYVTKIGTYDVTGLIEKIRTAARQEIKKSCKFLANGKSDRGYYYSKQNLAYDIAKDSIMANMYEKTNPIEPFDYESLITFI